MRRVARRVGRRGLHRDDVESLARDRLDTQKKTPVARERDREANEAHRRGYAAAQGNLPTRQLIFLDESGFRLGSSPRYGWAPIGTKAPGKTVCGKWTQITMLGAIALDGVRGMMSIDAATNTEVFAAFIEHVVGPALNPGDIVVMDNLSAHKAPLVRELIAGFGAQVLLLPPYSPEFNPIEQAWAKIKDLLRRSATLTREAFDCAFAAAIDQITDSDLAGWIGHAGYQLPST